MAIGVDANESFITGKAIFRGNTRKVAHHSLQCWECGRFIERITKRKKEELKEERCFSLIFNERLKLFNGLTWHGKKVEQFCCHLLDTTKKVDIISCERTEGGIKTELI